MNGRIARTNRRTGLCMSRLIDLCVNRRIGLCVNRRIGLCVNRRIGPCVNRRIPLRGAAVLTLAAVTSLVSAAEAPLAELIRNGRPAAALELIDAGADVNAAEGDGTTPLHWAVYHLDTALVDALLAAGANADAVNLFGSSPIAEAAKAGSVELTGRLLAAGADPDLANADGQTALMLAARAGATDVARALLTGGANANAQERWRGQTALMWAADSNSPQVVAALLEHGADVTVRAYRNDWPTQITSEPRAQYRPLGGLTALLYAARAGCTACVEALLDAGADIDRPSPEGVTPLMIALDNSRFATAARLIERGANPHYADWYGRTALYIAVDMASFGGPPRPAPDGPTGQAIVRQLLEAGVDPNPQLNFHRPSRAGNSGRFADDLLTTGATPLLRAVVGHDLESIRALLEHGALADLPNVMGVTPLMSAAGLGTPRLSQRRRLSAGGDVQATVIEMIDLLLTAGADIDARIVDTYSRTARIARPSSMTDQEGRSALYGASASRWPRVVRHLLDRGADAEIVDAKGRSPLDAALAQVNGDGTAEDIVQMLRDALEDGRAPE